MPDAAAPPDRGSLYPHAPRKMTARDRRSIEWNAAPPSRRGLWALGFVAVSLVALVAVPAYYGGKVAAAQFRITDVLLPAARQSSKLLLLLSRQMRRMDGFLLTGDRPVYREPYIAAIAETGSVLDSLGVLSRDLDVDLRDEVFERFATLGSDWTEWDIENQRIFDGDGGVDVQRRTQLRYEELQRATREFDRAIGSAVTQGRRSIVDARTLQNRLTFGLAMLALFATLIVGRVGFRYRYLTREREVQRREAVRARWEIDALLEATSDGVLGIDLEGKCTSLNRVGGELLGYTERAIVGRDVHDTLFHSRPDGSPNPRAGSPMLKALAAGEPCDSGDAAVLWRRRRVPLPARWSLRPLLDGIELRGAVLTFTDMTEIREKADALRRAVRQREDVVSIVSHDLRNPLGVTLAAADLLIDLPLDEDERRRQAEIILRSGRRMLRLIEDLLDVARIEGGALVLRPSVERLVPILEEARQVFEDQAERKGVELGVEAGEGDLEARVDRDRIIQALANLLDNAIRLTPEGGRIVLGVEDLGTDLSLTVSDTGLGIDPDLLESVFDRFSRSDGAERGAAGLGLAIVEGIVTAHGGAVSVDSRVGEGSTFVLCLPKAGP